LTIFKYLEAFPVPILLSYVLFAVFPQTETAVIVVAAFAFIGFRKWLEESRNQEIEKIRDELKMMNSKIESLQLGRSLGR
jgi:hypothetical protein